jgi:hypothetical protein
MSDLASALRALQADLPRIKRTAAGQAGPRRYRYASYDKIIAVVRPILGKHGFTWHTRPTLIGPDTAMRFVLAYALDHETGSITGFYPLREGPAQQQGSEITYARRYALCAVLDLEVEGEDTDGMDTPTRQPQRTRIPGSDHERLRYGTVEGTPEDKPAARGPLPASRDVWQDQPPGLMPVDDPEDKPGSITRDQQRTMHAKFTALGITDRSKRLAWTREALSLRTDELSSSSDLSYAEAGRLLIVLAETLEATTT